MQAPQTNFSALATAVKEMGARNAAIAGTYTEGGEAGTGAASQSVDDVLRDAPDSGKPIDDLDRYATR